MRPSEALRVFGAVLVEFAQHALVSVKLSGKSTHRRRSVVCASPEFGQSVGGWVSKCDARGPPAASVG